MTLEDNSSVKVYLLLGAWLIALVSTLIVIYAGEVLKMPVCHLCWYQRVFMIPLAIQLGIACFRQEYLIAIYTIPLTILGALFALYHYLLQMVPSLATVSPCATDGSGVRCDVIDWSLFGFITFPLLSLLAFLAILICLTISTKKSLP